MSSKFVGFKDGISVPICPIHKISKKGNAERMLEHLRRIQNNPERKIKENGIKFSVYWLFIGKPFSQSQWEKSKNFVKSFYTSKLKHIFAKISWNWLPICNNKKNVKFTEKCPFFRQFVHSEKPLYFVLHFQVNPSSFFSKFCFLLFSKTTLSIYWGKIGEKFSQ